MAQTQYLVRRLLDTPDIARVVPRLPAEVLHRVIEHCGLEACGEIVALATPRQLERVLDIDLWRSPAPGATETLDPGRFGEWIEFLAQSESPADHLERMDLDLIVGGLATHIRVFDTASVEPYTMLDGTPVAGWTFTGSTVEIGTFTVESRRPGFWDTTIDLLGRLHTESPALFQRVMRGCVSVSDAALETNSFHQLLEARDQRHTDLAADREARRDAQGYVASVQARAFLQASRGMGTDGPRPSFDPIARASLRDLGAEPIVDEAPAAEGFPPVAVVMEILSEAGVIAPPRALLGAGEPDDSRLAMVRGVAQTHPRAPEELAFLANVLMAGCAIQDRPFTPKEAHDAVLATCNLGLEAWPPDWSEPDLVTAFQIGWGVLHRDIGRYGAAVLAEVLTAVTCDDADIQRSMKTLRRELLRHLRGGEPWRARPALDAILMLDASAWAVLRSLLDECPTLHATLVPSEATRLRVDPASFTFVARTADVVAVRAYLETLAAVLAG